MMDANSIVDKSDKNLNEYALKSIEGFKLMTTKSIKEIVEESSRDLDEIALDLNKFAPIFEITDGNIRIWDEESEVLKNIFIHLIRNSIDHGIENIEERKSVGKSDTGTIKISLFQESENLKILYEDDGKGLNLPSLREKKQETNPGSGSVSDEEVAELIFQSGVSTKKNITDISGRGVGMDAVRFFLQEKTGSIEIILGQSSKKYPGFKDFKFIITLPDSFGLIPLFSWTVDKKAA
ncbi:MAG: ATP-binding protein [Oligoflexales bacterium]